jgi:eukaryotic-like serine/threonine-protein kinase
MNSKPPSAKSVFDDAHEIPPGPRRDAYVSEACAGVPELRQEVLDLLQAHDQAGGDFLNERFIASLLSGSDQAAAQAKQSSVVWQNTVDDKPRDEDGSVNELRGLQIGPYRIGKKLGSGGMGAVYQADQEHPVRRRVALKLIKPGEADDRVVGRFEAERQALALMHHPNIASVFDAGTTDDGRPFFVMEEVVDGVPIAKYCNDRQLPIRERLLLFIPVCQAIQHAHQKGVVHRDIKPTNVLITELDGKAVPKVIDFGLAKAIEGEALYGVALTSPDTAPGTLLYMSPEQLSAPHDLDTRTDIYSLGVLLYELLTETTPLDARRLPELGLLRASREIVEAEVTRPSSRLLQSEGQLEAVAIHRGVDPAKLVRQVRGELDWIVLKALEKNRDRRYASASDFATDIEHHLKDEPVQACPPSMRYQVGKFARKHRAVLAVAGVVVIALAAGIVELSVTNRTVSAALGKANESLAHETIALEETKVALVGLDTVIDGLARDRSKIRKSQKPIVRKALGLYAKFFEDPEPSPGAMERAADMELRAGNLFVLMNEPQNALAAYQRAIQRLLVLVSDFPDPPVYRYQLATSYFNLGYILLNDLPGTADAEAPLRRASELYEALAAEFPGDQRYRNDLADSVNNLGVLLRDKPDLPGAEKCFRQAIVLGEALVSEEPRLTTYKTRLAAILSNLANAIRDQNKPEEAITYYDQAITHLRSVGSERADFEDGREFLRNAHWDRANALEHLGRNSAAVSDWKLAIALDDGRSQTTLRSFLAAAEMEAQVAALPPTNSSLGSGALLFQAAQAEARAMATASKPDVAEKTLATLSATRALHLLEQAKSAGYFESPEHEKLLKSDASFGALRAAPEHRKAFTAFLDSLAKR